MQRDPAPPSVRALLLAASSSALLLAPAAHATTCQDVCPGSGACTISSTINVTPGSEIDCSGRDLTITVGGTLKVTGGEMWIYADDLVVNGAGGSILGVDGPGGETSSVFVELTGDLTLAGKIRVNGARGGGEIGVFARGNITIPESGTDGIEADGTSSGADGGQIRVEAGGSLTILDPIHAAGAGSSVTHGGTIELIAGGDILTDEHGHVSAEGLAGGGGLVLFRSTGGDVIIREHVDVEGRGSTGEGGEIEISAYDRVEIHEQLTARGGVNNSGGEAFGGHVRIRAGCGGISVGANVLANGGQLGTRSESGTISLESSGDITVSTGATIDTRALASAGSGGTISVEAGQSAVLSSNAVLDSRGGSGAGGIGGHVQVTGCSVQTAGSSKIDVSGDSGGSIVLHARSEAPATGTQPLRVQTGALLKAKGAVGDRDGSINLAPLNRKLGRCSNDGSIACDLDSSCTVGCQTGDCIYANPDTDGLVSQFDLAPVRNAEPALGICDSVCEP